VDINKDRPEGNARCVPRVMHTAILHQVYQTRPGAVCPEQRSNSPPPKFTFDPGDFVRGPMEIVPRAFDRGLVCGRRAE